MANAPVIQGGDIIELTNGNGFPITYICAAGTTISKGILLKLSDPRTVTAAEGIITTFPTAFAGISAMDKDGTDSSTTISAWTNGIFDLRCSGAATVGDKLVLTGFNEVKSVSLLTVAQYASLATVSGIVGTALETASDGEKIAVWVGKL